MFVGILTTVIHNTLEIGVYIYIHTRTFVYLLFIDTYKLCNKNLECCSIK